MSDRTRPPGTGRPESTSTPCHSSTNSLGYTNTRVRTQQHRLGQNPDPQPPVHVTPLSWDDQSTERGKRHPWTFNRPEPKIVHYYKSRKKSQKKNHRQKRIKNDYCKKVNMKSLCTNIFSAFCVFVLLILRIRSTGHHS